MDDKNTNKQFRLYDDTGKYIRLSVDETIARGLNKWQNWKCSAGIRALYIDYDGNVWRCNSMSGRQTDNFNKEGWHKLLKATYPNKDDIPMLTKDQWQQNQLLVEYRRTEDAYLNKMLPNTEETKKTKKGYLGNIVEGFDIEEEWSACPWDSCSCGADVILSKVKDDSYKPLLAVTNNSWVGKESTSFDLVDTVDTIVANEMNFPIPYQILWDLGRQCNYDCSYCWPNVHNRYEPHKDYQALINTCDLAIDNWSKGESIRWNFGGGEPTLHPKFLDLLKYLKSKNQWTMVTTNGTRDYKYWSEAVQYLNSINLSAHFDGLLTEREEDRFVKNVQAICKHFDEHNDDHWLEIKLMAPPQYVDRAFNLKKKILENTTISQPGANDRIKGFLSLVPIRGMFGNSGKLIEYTEEQLTKFQYQ
jgi:organic radical activating enzyme